MRSGALSASRPQGSSVGRFGYRLALFTLLAQVVLAIYAPLIASDRPLVLFGSDRREMRRECNTLVGAVARLEEWAGSAAPVGALEVERAAVGRALERIESLISEPGQQLRADLVQFGARLDAAFDAAGRGPDLPGSGSLRIGGLATPSSELEQAVSLWRRRLLDPQEVQMVRRWSSPLLGSLSGWNVFLMFLLPVVSAGFLRGRRPGSGRLWRAILFAAAVGALHGLSGGGAAFDPVPFGERIASGEVEAEFVLFPPIAHGFAEIDVSAVHRAPALGAAGSTSVLGTDSLGRDLLVRLIWGGRISLAVGFLSTLMALALGVSLGALAGLRGGFCDTAISRVIEIVQSFPAFFLVLTAAALIPAETIHPMLSISLLIGMVRWTGIARLVRGEFLRLREEEFVAAARAAGFSEFHVGLREILPNALTPVLVAGAFSVAAGILTESGISFLGFGVQPPVPSWGALLSETRVPDHWWMQVFPGLLIFATVAATNVVAEGLRDRLDPHGVSPDQS